MKNAISRFGKFLSGMVMPNIGAFIAWGFLTALFIEKGWFPNERLSSMVSPMLSYLLPILIAGQGGAAKWSQATVVVSSPPSPWWAASAARATPC